LCRKWNVRTDFETLPPKRKYPDYYVTIKMPISLAQISDKLKKGEYHDVDAMKADFTLMVNNAKTYNVKGSQIYKDAVAIQVGPPKT